MHSVGNYNMMGELISKIYTHHETVVDSPPLSVAIRALALPLFIYHKVVSTQLVMEISQKKMRGGGGRRPQFQNKGELRGVQNS